MWFFFSMINDATVLHVFFFVSVRCVQRLHRVLFRQTMSENNSN